MSQYNGQVNPVYVALVKADPLLGLPLADASSTLQPRPPARIEVSQTQLDAWEKVRGELGNRQLVVLTAIAEIGPCNIRDVVIELRSEMNVISARMHELKALGLIVPFNDPVTGDQARRNGGALWQARHDWKEFIEVVESQLI